MPTPVIVALVAAGCALLIVQFALLYLLIRQHGRVLLQQDELHARLARAEEALKILAAQVRTAAAVRTSRLNRDGLSPGTPAPEFSLPDLVGQERALDEFRGKPTLLVFSDPNCAPCQQLAPRLKELHDHHRDRDLNVVLIGRGDPEANRAKALEHGLSFPVLLQQRWEISREYATFATPAGYLIDEQGVIAKEVAIGGDAILQLVTEADWAA